MVSVKDRLSCFSNSFERASPGGVMKSPAGFLDCNRCGLVSPAVGSGCSGFVGMNMRLDV